ncbi:glycosyltransferase family 2 protein [Clostridium oryzae]|uniref:N-acetylglucosaminyl-diphospho-decaprenol L-rhamnosyltransferase n=1 Tax=Clostridium oryzae TaxID=1450648 RepID=A0A1V4IZ41_9CLOT|nr:glycosyltransferase family 2 protein [Clostridium oryzae]OPJ65044.1 N-acetylglucosaminyl-diphospho-decaprenol L-rhamnosyltransferase [Clostridium oryzae]
MELSIIIVNWNGKKLMGQCIQSIKNSISSINYEIIVVDNGSSDGSVEYLEVNFKDVLIIKNDKNYGFAHANNQGMERAEGEYLLLLNSDTIVQKNAIEKCIGRIKRDSRIGVLGCRLLNQDGSLQPSCYNFNSLKNSILFKTRLINFIPKEERYKYEVRIKSFDYVSELEVNYVCGAFMMMPRSLVEKIGKLDESFFMYAEEADFCKRAKKCGYKILFYPEAEIIHLGGGSSKTINEITEKRRIVSRLKFIKKHNGNTYYSIYRVMSLADAMMKAIFSTACRRGVYKAKIKAICSMKYE